MMMYDISGFLPRVGEWTTPGKGAWFGCSTEIPGGGESTLRHDSHVYSRHVYSHAYIINRTLFGTFNMPTSYQ